ncbi:hypothetical protein HDR63_01965 [bacterium]|nr:hypothetical protein [bacterium]
MRGIKKFWIALVALLPTAALGAAPFVVAGLAGLGVIAGFSIYRSNAPVDMAGALDFFSTCWTCQLFSDVMMTMSDILPNVYHSVGHVIIPFAVALTAIWFVWQLVSGYLNATVENPWTITSNFARHLIKLTFVISLLAVPLPRMITSAAIEPIFNIGLSLNRAVGDDQRFAECVVAAAVADPSAASNAAAERGAYSLRLRHNLACEIAGIHQMTGLGMTTGWTLLNMAFDQKYMHKIMWNLPIFPNLPILFGGLLILVLFFFALLPIPLYFLDIFVTLTMDLIMLPLFLLGWLFSGWKLIPGGGGKSILDIINDTVKSTVGIALVGVFLTFAIMFLNAVFGHWQGAAALATAMAQNDPTILMDGLMLHNDSLITIILMGLFIAMFMNMIPKLVNMLFKIDISQKTFDAAKKHLETIWANAKKWYAAIKK